MSCFWMKSKVPHPTTSPASPTFSEAHVWWSNDLISSKWSTYLIIIFMQEHFLKYTLWIRGGDFHTSLSRLWCCSHQTKWKLLSGGLSFCVLLNDDKHQQIPHVCCAKTVKLLVLGWSGTGSHFHAVELSIAASPVRNESHCVCTFAGGGRAPRTRGWPQPAVEQSGGKCPVCGREHSVRTAENSSAEDRLGETTSGAWWGFLSFRKTVIFVSALNPSSL